MAVGMPFKGVIRQSLENLWMMTIMQVQSFEAGRLVIKAFQLAGG